MKKRDVGEWAKRGRGGQICTKDAKENDKNASWTDKTFSAGS